LTLEPILTARTPFAPPQKRVHHVVTNLATEARSFENFCTPVRCTRKRDFRFFPEDEISATIRYETLPAPTPTIHVAPASITHPLPLPLPLALTCLEISVRDCKCIFILCCFYVVRSSRLSTFQACMGVVDLLTGFFKTDDEELLASIVTSRCKSVKY